MLILAFESSAKPASVALVQDGALLSQSTQVSALTHSRTLLPMAEDMLKNAELTLQDVDLIAVAHGPGSFTGVRIGVAAAKEGVEFTKTIPATKGRASYIGERSIGFEIIRRFRDQCAAIIPAKFAFFRNERS